MLPLHCRCRCRCRVGVYTRVAAGWVAWQCPAGRASGEARGEGWAGTAGLNCRAAKGRAGQNAAAHDGGRHTTATGALIA
eukprot:290804-Chlamydomonas_euryale.AAC.1